MSNHSVLLITDKKMNYEIKCIIKIYIWIPGFESVNKTKKD